MRKKAHTLLKLGMRSFPDIGYPSLGARIGSQRAKSGSTWLHSAAQDSLRIYSVVGGGSLGLTLDLEQIVAHRYDRLYRHYLAPVANLSPDLVSQPGCFCSGANHPYFILCSGCPTLPHLQQHSCVVALV